MMKLLLKIGLSIFAILVVLKAKPQELSLDQSIEKALANNRSLKNASLDVLSSQEVSREIKSSLLPKININGSYQYFLKKPVNLIPSSLLGGNDGGYIEAGFATRQTSMLSGEASQTIYNKQALLNYKSSKLLSNVQELSLKEARQDIVFNVTMTYYSAQVISERKKILNQNLANMTRLIENMNLLLKNGLISQTTFNRLLVNNNNLIAIKEQVENEEYKNYNLLKLLIGEEMSKNISVQQLQDLNPGEILLNNTDNRTARFDLQLLHERKEMAVVDKLSAKAAFYPTLTSSLSFGLTGYNESFQPFRQINNKYYQGSAFALNLNIPVFDGFRRSAQVSQKQLTIRRIANEIDAKIEAINREINDAWADYNTSASKLVAASKNKLFSERIYSDVELQFKSGLAGINDVMDAQNQMMEAQSIYTTSLIQLRIAQLSIKRSEGTLFQ
jgi:outer membrane protein